MAKTRKSLEVRKCVVCGKEFKQIRGTQIVCSTACRHKRDRELQKQWREKNIGYMSKKTGQEMPNVKKPKKKKAEKQKANSNYEKIAELTIKAREEGLSYGQYDAKKRAKMVKIVRKW